MRLGSIYCLGCLLCCLRLGCLLLIVILVGNFDFGFLDLVLLLFVGVYRLLEFGVFVLTCGLDLCN